MMSMDSIVRSAHAKGHLVVQPRMGFAPIDQMEAGLAAVKRGVAYGFGTITVDSYTRVGDEEGAKRALISGSALNGFPIAAHDPGDIERMLASIVDDGFDIQVRHGSADPRTVFHAATAVGLRATEGGPVSYNLPYSRMPLAQSVAAWDDATRFWVAHAEAIGHPTHLETFAGCMYGQMCPPDLLVTLSVLEAMFFAKRGVPEVSLSLAQGPSFEQDVGALIALDRLAARHLPDDVPYHMVFYSFMGLFPQTETGSEYLIRDSARIARLGGASRLIVKTAAEARGIPTVAENIEALNWARSSADAMIDCPGPEAMEWADKIEQTVETLLAVVCGDGTDLAHDLLSAFADGVLDVPFVVHPDNRGLTRSVIDSETGALVWAETGNMPITHGTQSSQELTTDSFHSALSYVRRTYDAASDPKTLTEA